MNLRSESVQEVPINYNYAVASAIYRRIMSVRPELGLHSRRDFKFFTFSRLLSKDYEVKGDKLRMRGCHFFFSSPDAEIVSAFVEGILEEPEFRIAGANFVVERVEALRTPKIESEVTFETLSPIVVRTVVEIEGRRRTWDLYPSERKFYENLRRNLLRKYEAFYGELPGDEFEIEVLEVTKLPRVRVKNTWHRSTMMRFVARGEPPLLKFGYEAGFGEKNAMGFGMVEVVKPDVKTGRKPKSPPRRPSHEGAPTSRRRPA